MQDARYGTFENGEASAVWHKHCAPKGPGSVPFIGQDLLLTGGVPTCASCSAPIELDPVLMAAAHTLRFMHQLDEQRGGLDGETQGMLELLEAHVIRKLPNLWDVPTPQRPGGQFFW